MLRALLLAPPGAGKGTQGERIAERYNIPHIATGDLLRLHVQRETELGVEAKSYMDSGGLVPDDLINLMVLDHIGGDKPLTGFVLDGFPRTMHQATAAYEWGKGVDLTFRAVIVLSVGEDELVRRLVERGQSSGRSDDTEDVIRHRLETYNEQTAPLLDFYRDRGILCEIDGVGPVDEVTQRIVTRLNEIMAA